MLRIHTNRRRLAMLCLPLLAATLACSGLSLPSIPTAQPTATPAPGQLPAVDPCSLLSADEAKALVGQSVGLPQASGGACLYSDQPVGMDGVGVYALPASQAQDFLGQYVPALQASDPKLDPTLIAKLSAANAAGDMPAAVNALFDLMKGLPGYDTQQLDGVGSAALWSWRTTNQADTGALIAAKPGVLVALVLSRTSTSSEAASQAAMETIVMRILASLPDNFTIRAAALNADVDFYPALPLAAHVDLFPEIQRAMAMLPMAIALCISGLFSLTRAVNRTILQSILIQNKLV